eukprot:8754723-Pyramimonas_sp.AAC.1
MVLPAPPGRLPQLPSLPSRPPLSLGAAGQSGGWTTAGVSPRGTSIAGGPRNPERGVLEPRRLEPKELRTHIVMENSVL